MLESAVIHLRADAIEVSNFRLTHERNTNATGVHRHSFNYKPRIQPIQHTLMVNRKVPKPNTMIVVRAEIHASQLRVSQERNSSLPQLFIKVGGAQ